MVKFGVIGCGHWGPNFVRNLSQLPGASVWGACDIDRHRLKHIKAVYPFVEAFTDYKKILDNWTVDAVVISTPAKTHYHLAKEALKKRKHVLVEKPISLDLGHAEELIDLAKRMKRILMVGHTFMYNHAVRKVREIIKGGRLGRVYYLHSKRTNLGPLRNDVSAMGDLAPHDISIFSYILGAHPTAVTARGQYYLQRGKEDVTFITLNYPKKIMANIHVSWLDPRKVREITVVGSKRMVVFDDLNRDEPVKLYDKKVVRKRYESDYNTFKEFQMLIKEKGVTVPKVKAEEPMKVECKHFLKCIHSNKIPLSDGTNGLSVLKTLIAIQESIDKKGKCVRVDRCAASNMR